MKFLNDLWVVGRVVVIIAVSLTVLMSVVAGAFAICNILVWNFFVGLPVLIIYVTVIGALVRVFGRWFDRISENWD